MKAFELRSPGGEFAPAPAGELASLVWAYMLALTAVSLLIFRKVEL